MKSSPPNINPSPNLPTLRTPTISALPSTTQPTPTNPKTPNTETQPSPSLQPPGSPPTPTLWWEFPLLTIASPLTKDSNLIPHPIEHCRIEEMDTITLMWLLSGYEGGGEECWLRSLLCWWWRFACLLCLKFLSFIDGLVNIFDLYSWNLWGGILNIWAIFWSILIEFVIVVFIWFITYFQICANK